MSDYSSVAPPQNNTQSPAFAAAVERARLLAAKCAGGTKRSLEDGQEPSAKKLAGHPDYQSAEGMSGNRPGGPGGPPMLQDQVNEYIRVPDKMVGLIIGRKGEQISRLQAESGCKIQMAADSGGQPERMCTLTGSREAVERAKEMVHSIVNQRGNDGGPPDGPQQGRMGGPPGNNNQGFLEIMVPGPKVGLIIGKGGETIKQLQEKSGTKMVVIQDKVDPEFVTEKPLRITGDPQKVEYAKQLVMELISEKDMQYGGGGGGGGRGGGGGKPGGRGGQQWGGGGMDDYDQQSMGSDGHEVLVPRIAVGVVIGKSGEMIKKIQADTGARVQFQQTRDEGPGDKRCFIQGTPKQVEDAKEVIISLIESVNRRNAENGGRNSGPPRNNNQRNGGDGSDGGWGGPPQDKIEVSFTISSTKCGVIIGKGGEVIKQINAQSGAHCELDRKSQNARDSRTFVIRGSPDCVETARRLIQDKVGMALNFVVESGGGGGGGNNGDDYGGYGGGPGGPGGDPGAWGYNPQWHPSQQQQQGGPSQPDHQQQQQVPVNPVTGQPDYSQQWIDYYKAMGMMKEAEAIESQVKIAKGGMQQPGGPQPPSQQPNPLHPQGGVNAANGGGVGGNAMGGGGGGGGGQPDYSAQWADYYRSMGKIKEAEMIEAQMKQKQMMGGASGVTPTGTPTPGGYGAPGMAPYGAPQGYGAQGQPGGQYPNYAPYHQQQPAYPQQDQP